MYSTQTQTRLQTATLSPLIQADSFLSLWMYCSRLYKNRHSIKLSVIKFCFCFISLTVIIKIGPHNWLWFIGFGRQTNSTCLFTCWFCFYSSGTAHTFRFKELHLQANFLVVQVHYSAFLGFSRNKKKSRTRKKTQVTSDHKQRPQLKLIFSHSQKFAS